jgi:predicted RNA-binding Zn ribbon-like protein
VLVARACVNFTGKPFQGCVTCQDARLWLSIVELPACRTVRAGPMTATRPPPFFIADNLGLDFLNTIAVPVDTKVEWLASGEDLLAWLEQAELVPENVRRALRKRAVPGELDAIAAQARALRDWFKLFVYKHMGRSLPPNALRQLEPLNELLARDDEFGQIVPRGRREREDGGASGLTWRPQRRWQTPESLLFPLARSLADLVCTEDFTDVKACEGPTCTLLFIDRTRGRARRWCSMAVCGNRAKQAAHRKRARKARKRKAKYERHAGWPVC